MRKTEEEVNAIISPSKPVSSLSLNGLRMRVLGYITGMVRNEVIMWIYANVVHTSSSFRPHTHTHTHTI